MSQGPTSTTTSILLVEADISLRRLISLGLRHRGVEVIEATSLATLPTLSSQRPPDLLVLDVDSGVHSNWSLVENMQTHPTLSTLPIVVLGWERALDGTGSMPAVATTTQQEVTCLSKPFDARTLHQAIERLLKKRAEQKAALEAKAEAVLLASYATHTAPSIWPIITAAGLLIAVIGMLLQAAVAAVGILIVLVASLCWALGTKPEAEWQSLTANDAA